MGEKGASVKGVTGACGRGFNGFAFAPGFNPSNRIHATSFCNIQAPLYYVAVQQKQDPAWRSKA
ncbi:MAG TPA: hypothetical protein VHY57_02120, partial [Rhizomicrobium sp.]|nr:hypothetical protein [Rhizomicrobium sp.]